MAEQLILGAVPGNAQLSGYLVNVIKVVGELEIFSGMGGLVGEIEAWKVTVLIESLKGSIVKCVASVPYTSPVFVPAFVGNALSTKAVLCVVFNELLTEDMSEGVIVNP